MIQRCVDLYGGRWCAVCGSCSCRRAVEERRPAWAPAGADPACPLHGVASAHGHVKVLTCKPDEGSGRGFRTRVQERLRR